MHTTTRSALVTLLTLTTASAVRAQTAAPAAQQPGMLRVKEAKPGLLRQATITLDAATRTALQQVTNGQIREAEIEQEKGKLVYSYDIKMPGKSGIDEVLVDAKSGAVVSHTHESPAAEAAEARKDAAAARKVKAKGAAPDRRWRESHVIRRRRAVVHRVARRHERPEARATRA